MWGGWYASARSCPSSEKVLRLVGTRFHGHDVVVVGELHHPVRLHADTTFLVFDLFKAADYGRQITPPFLASQATKSSLSITYSSSS